MINYLPIALWLVCFYDAIVMLLLPSSATLLMAEDGSVGRFIAAMAACAIGLYVLTQYGFSKLSNKWIPALIVCIVFSSFHSPNVSFESIFVPKDPGLFNFKPMFEVFMYLLMFLGMCNIPFTILNKEKIYKTIAWIGIIYSGYIVLQHCGLDQIYHLVGTSIDQLSRNPKDGGFISQPVFAAAILSLCLPFVIRYKLYLGVLVIIAILLTGNRSALVASAITGLFLITKSKRYVLMAIVAYIGLLALAMGIYWLAPNIHLPIDSDGRLHAWGLMIKDFLHPHFPGVSKSYVLTGMGIGSFPLTFPFYNHSLFYQAHNEYLELFLGLSFIGFYLFIRMIKHIFDTVQDHYVCAGLIALAVFAITNPIWHVAQLQFLTIFLVGLVYNKTIGANYVEV